MALVINPEQVMMPKDIISLVKKDKTLIKESNFVSGVYFLLRGEKIVYVGESNNCDYRIATHIHEGVKKFDGFYIFPIRGIYDRKRNEKFLIKKLNPEYNVVHKPTRKKKRKKPVIIYGSNR
jgi:excinuclease UvrABC nuclease subunit